MTKTNSGSLKGLGTLLSTGFKEYYIKVPEGMSIAVTQSRIKTHAYYLRVKAKTETLFCCNKESKGEVLIKITLSKPIVKMKVGRKCKQE